MWGICKYAVCTIVKNRKQLTSDNCERYHTSECNVRDAQTSLNYCKNVSVYCNNVFLLLLITHFFYVSAGSPKKI